MINIYLNWQDRNTFIGVGKIVSKLDYKPVICIVDTCYRPQLCRIKIEFSEYYKKGHEISVDIPFEISEQIAEKLNKKENREYNVPYSFFEDILEMNNPVTYTYEQIKLKEYVKEIKRKYVNRGLAIPQKASKYIKNKYNDICS